nr:hypothetical protein CFP56_16214 [Quercus suber]
MFSGTWNAMATTVASGSCVQVKFYGQMYQQQRSRCGCRGLVVRRVYESGKENLLCDKLNVQSASGSHFHPAGYRCRPLTVIGCTCKRPLPARSDLDAADDLITPSPSPTWGSS